MLANTPAVAGKLLGLHTPVGSPLKGGKQWEACGFLQLKQHQFCKWFWGVCDMSQNVDDLHQKDEDVSPHLAL